MDLKPSTILGAAGGVGTVLVLAAALLLVGVNQDSDASSPSSRPAASGQPGASGQGTGSGALRGLDALAASNAPQTPGPNARPLGVHAGASMPVTDADKQAELDALLNAAAPTGPIDVVIEDETDGLVTVQEAAHLAHLTDEELEALANAENPWTRLVEADPGLAPLHDLLLQTSRDKDGLARLLSAAIGGDIPGVKITPPARAQLRLSLGDMNADGRLDAQDMNVLLALSGPTTPNGADFDMNGVINDQDVATLSSLIRAHAEQ
ncbi:MAG: hypothetical protein R3B68_06780 [Phycisphaerales bacterium]